MQLDPSQLAGVELLTGSAEISVLTGGPGTGKTTTLRTVLDRFDASGVTYELASPTGKAAKRMAESTGRPARTVHRLLEWLQGDFLRCASNPLECDAVVIDEASMLDIELFASVLDAVPPDGRLILVGDADQLPSVGPGQVLADLVASPDVPTARLTTLHRAAQESWVCRNAALAVRGEALELEGEWPDFAFVECDSALGVQAAAVEVMRADPSAQLLTPQRPGQAGTHALNAAIQGALNPRRALSPSMATRIGEQKGEFRVGDRVIQTRNNYDLEVFNGEVGSIVDIAGNEVTVDYGDRRMVHKGEQVFELQHAYALTVHKSQGSEWPHVVVVAHSTHSYMLERTLFYTAITRAKARVTIIGDRKGIRAALSKGDKPRNSTLLERMAAAGEETEAA